MVNEGGETMDLTDDERAALAVLDDMTREACAAYGDAAAAWERASMAAALTLVRRALAAEAEIARLNAAAAAEADATRAQWRADDEKIYALRAEVERLRALIAGRKARPTREELDALGAVNATLRVQWQGCEDEIPTRGAHYWTAVASVPGGATWWAHGADGALIEWPEVKP